MNKVGAIFHVFNTLILECSLRQGYLPSLPPTLGKRMFTGSVWLRCLITFNLNGLVCVLIQTHAHTHAKEKKSPHKSEVQHLQTVTTCIILEIIPTNSYSTWFCKRQFVLKFTLDQLTFLHRAVWCGEHGRCEITARFGGKISERYTEYWNSNVRVCFVFWLDLLHGHFAIICAALIPGKLFSYVFTLWKHDKHPK